MKKLLTISLIALMALTIVGCAKKEETIGGNTENPMSEVESLEKLNELTNGKLAKPAVMGVGNEKYFTITSGELLIADYQFEINGDKCDFRFSDRGSLEEDFSGYFVNGKAAFPSTNIENGIEYNLEGDAKLARWANVDGIYTFAYESKDMDEETFKNIVDELVTMTKSEQGNVDGEALAGGWTKAEDPTVTDELSIMFNEALEGLTGALYTPLALLETQVVAGTNYKFLCSGKTVTATPSYKNVLVSIYKPINGEKPELLNIEDFNPTTEAEHRSFVSNEGENVIYTTLDIKDGKCTVTTITYTFDNNGKIKTINNETVFDTPDNAKKGYEEIIAANEAYKPLASLEGDRVFVDTSEVMISEWGDITRDELVETLKLTAE